MPYCYHRRQAGSAIIEFALVAPLLLLLILGIVELGMMFFAGAVLESATALAARAGKPGFSTGGLSIEDYIRQEVTGLSGGYLDAGLLAVNTTSYGNENDSGSITVYRVSYPWTPFTLLGNGASWTLTASATLPGKV